MKTGFTLIELLVVIAIIAILTAIFAGSACQPRASRLQPLYEDRGTYHWRDPRDGRCFWSDTPEVTSDQSLTEETCR